MEAEQDAQVRDPEESTDSSVFRRLDSSRRVLLLKLLLPRDPTSQLTPTRYAQVYLAVVSLSWIAPLIIAALTQPTLISPSQALALPFLLDVNVAMICLISTPFLLFLLMREKEQLALALSSLHQASVIQLDSEEAAAFIKRWEKRFADGNVRAQVVGLIAALIVFSLNYFGAVNVNHHNTLWQAYGASPGSYNLAGWFYLIPQVGLFFFVATQLVVREIYIVKMFFELTRVSTLNIKPMHPDRVGGLKPVANLGLNYQAGVALMGLNLGTMIITSGIIGTGVQTNIIILSLIVYALVAPLVFVGPLLPFRRHMVRSKSDIMQRISRRFQSEMNSALAMVDEGTLDGAEFAELKNLNELYAIVEKLPEWPFDVGTLQKVASVFLSPLVPIVLSWLFTQLVSGSAAP